MLESLFIVKLVTFLRTPFFKNTLTEHLGWLLLICPLFKSQSFKDIIVQFQLYFLLLAALRILFEETMTRTMSSAIARSTKKAF